MRLGFQKDLGYESSPSCENWLEAILQRWGSMDEDFLEQVSQGPTHPRAVFDEKIGLFIDQKEYLIWGWFVGKRFNLEVWE